MKVHIENLNITLAGHQRSAGLIAALTIAEAAKASSVPALGDKWPGVEAVYAGVSLSKTDDSLVHLILWLDAPEKRMNYADAVAYAESVNPGMESHLPTRHQSIALFDHLRDRFNQGDYHWTLTKTKSGNTAFIQDFFGGFQDNGYLYNECRVRAVSEIPL